MQSAIPARVALRAVCIGLLAGCPDTAASGHDGGARSADAGAHAADAGDASVAVACDVELPTKCTDPDIVYADVEPIIQRRCLECHDGSTKQWPLTSYSHVADWFIEVRSMIATCSMPPPDSGVTMPTAEREQLLLWIRCGYHR